jgi:AcrR family transcriptional regulator
MAPTTPDMSPDKRARLVDTAERLAHEHGFHKTSLADIAHESGVQLGNVYHYFKTKEALGQAIVEKLLKGSARMRERLQQLPDPKARLEAFINMTFENRGSLARSGCQMGTLCTELHKEGGPLAEQAARLFGEILAWMKDQFLELGYGDKSSGLGLQLLSALQGASLLTHTFHDPTLIEAESTRLKQWIRAL